MSGGRCPAECSRNLRLPNFAICVLRVILGASNPGSSQCHLPAHQRIMHEQFRRKRFGLRGPRAQVCRCVVRGLRSGICATSMSDTTNDWSANLFKVCSNSRSRFSLVDEQTQGKSYQLLRYSRRSVHSTAAPCRESSRRITLPEEKPSRSGTGSGENGTPRKKNIGENARAIH
jgi:hypothetical protein